MNRAVTQLDRTVGGARQLGVGGGNGGDKRAWQDNYHRATMMKYSGMIGEAPGRNNHSSFMRLFRPTQQEETRDAHSRRSRRLHIATLLILAGYSFSSGGSDRSLARRSLIDEVKAFVIGFFFDILNILF